jgi:arylsulfatase A-like enzyme
MNLLSERGYKLFCQLLVLTLLFILVQVSFFIQSLNLYFDDFSFVASKLEIPYTILPGILWFCFAQIVVHVGALIFVCIVTLTLAEAFKLSTKDCDRLGLALWFLGLLTVLFSNQMFFPNSRFAYLLRFLVPDTLALVLLFFLYSIWTLALVFTAYELLASLQWRARAAVVLVAGLLGGNGFYQNYLYQTIDAGTEAKPNIILIGVDSLRPDFLDFFGSPLKTHFFNSFLSQATVFTNTFTPLARTFPSWVGILTGAYPKESGIRFNLANNGPNPRVTLLTTVLHQHGYKTVYATDEARFSNIDKRFGFDQVITPPMGLNDFLVGSFNDFPLANLLVNTPMGQWLFPHSYGSRPVHITYNPDSFLKLLKPHLRQNRKQPLFLAVHFCLPHSPYIWSSYPGYSEKNVVARYQASILRVDQQLSDFLALLEQDQLLKHAVVVLLSDHGEALELSGDRITSARGFVSGQVNQSRRIPHFFPPSADKERVDQSAGHGTDVLGFPQYHSLLAFKLFGLKGQVVKKVSDPALLLDIKPTILSFLNIPENNTGLSLRNIILGKASRLDQRNIFLESDFSPEAIRSVYPEMRNLIFEGVELFKIDPKTTRIYVRDGMGKMIIASKQYALVEQDWVLALYPQEKGKMIPVLVQLSTGKWTTNMSLAFAQSSPLKHMLYTLKQFYGADLKHL